jgi:hypothetical protein
MRTRTSLPLVRVMRCMIVRGNLRLKHGQSSKAESPKFCGHEFAVQLLRKDTEYRHRDREDDEPVCVFVYVFVRARVPFCRLCASFAAWSSGGTYVLKRGYSVFDMAITMRCSAFKRAKILIILKLCIRTDTQRQTKTRAGGCRRA